MKAIRINILLTILSLTLLSNECKKDMDCRMTFINNTDETLWYDIDCYNYPDSLSWTGNCYDAKVSPMSDKELCIERTWEEIFSSNEIETLKVYVINYDTARFYDMTTILKDLKYLKRYDLSLDDLKRNDFIITYP